MNLTPLPTGPFEEICYVVWNAQKQALIFDPGHDADCIEDVIANNALEVAAYVCTHGHADHINALAKLHSAQPAPIAIHSADRAWAFEERNQIEPYYPVPQQPDDAAFMALETQKNWELGGLHFQCIETPGHTPGSCCLLFPEAEILIAGDTLFKGSCGRTDLPGGDPRKMKDSLNKLKQLPETVRVYPGHGPDTTIGIERQTNFYMQ